MDISGTYTFNFDRQTVWNTLMAPHAIEQAIPGVQEMISIEDEPHAWHIVVKIGVSSISGTYRGILRMTDIYVAHQYRLTAEGQGQQSFINGTALITLTDDPTATRTPISWEAQANLSGKLASVAQRFIKSAAGMLSRQFFGNLEKQLKAAADARLPIRES